MFGAITRQNDKAQYKKDNLCFKKIFFISFSKDINARQRIKYIAAYLAKKAKPINMPNKIKFNLLGFSLIINICNKLKDQKKMRIISVETKKDEKVTAGIKKKVIAVKKANSLLSNNFFESKKMT